MLCIKRQMPINTNIYILNILRIAGPCLGERLQEYQQHHGGWENLKVYNQRKKQHGSLGDTFRHGFINRCIDHICIYIPVTQQQSQQRGFLPSNNRLIFAPICVEIRWKYESVAIEDIELLTTDDDGSTANTHSVTQTRIIACVVLLRSTLHHTTSHYA